jgi:hypothetical protein
VLIFVLAGTSLVGRQGPNPPAIIAEFSRETRSVRLVGRAAR